MDAMGYFVLQQLTLNLATTQVHVQERPVVASYFDKLKWELKTEERQQEIYKRKKRNIKLRVKMERKIDTFTEHNQKRIENGTVRFMNSILYLLGVPANVRGISDSADLRVIRRLEMNSGSVLQPFSAVVVLSKCSESCFFKVERVL